MTDWTIGGVALPEDMEWLDELQPARRQAESVALSGGMIVQTSTQVAGLPMTLRTPAGVYVTRAQIKALIALRDNPATDAFTVGHPDGRSFSCRFSHANGSPIDYANTMFRSPPEDSDGWHTLTLRLMTA